MTYSTSFVKLDLISERKEIPLNSVSPGINNSI